MSPLQGSKLAAVHVSSQGVALGWFVAAPTGRWLHAALLCRMNRKTAAAPPAAHAPVRIHRLPRSHQPPLINN